MVDSCVLGATPGGDTVIDIPGIGCSVGHQERRWEAAGSRGRGYKIVQLVELRIRAFDPDVMHAPVGAVL